MSWIYGLKNIQIATQGVGIEVGHFDENDRD